MPAYICPPRKNRKLNLHPCLTPTLCLTFYFLKIRAFIPKALPYTPDLFNNFMSCSVNMSYSLANLRDIRLSVSIEELLVCECLSLISRASGAEI